MLVTIQLSPETEARAKLQAKASGVALEQFLSLVIEGSLTDERPFQETASIEEWQAALDEFADSSAFDKPVQILDDSRDRIYREREDSQL